MPTAKKLPSGSWRCQVYDYTDDNGKRHYESFTTDTKKDAEFMAAQFAMEKEQRRHMSSSSLRNAINVYIETSDAILSPTTIQGYRKIQKNAFADIMELPLKKLTRQSLQDAVNLEAKRPNAKRKDKAPISAKTVHNEYGLITAVLNKYIPSLDCTVRLPQVETYIKDLPLPDEIYAAVKGSEVELAVMLAMWLSFSMSEVRGLKKSKSIRGNYLVVEEVVVDVDNQSIVKRKGKTKTRTRMHRMPAYIQELISRTDPQEDRLVPMTRSQVYFRFVKLIEKAGLKPMTYHDLRHVNASVMALLQVPDKYAQERGGWKTDAVMKKVYTHTFGQERQRVDNMIDEYFEEQIGITEPDILEGYMAWLRNIGRQDTLELREKYAAFMAEISETCNTICNTK